MHGPCRIGVHVQQLDSVNFLGLEVGRFLESLGLATGPWPLIFLHPTSPSAASQDMTRNHGLGLGCATADDDAR